MRYLITLGLILLFDWTAFQPFMIISENWSGAMQMILKLMYWSIPCFVILTTIWFVKSNGAVKNNESFSLLRAILIIIYLSKFIIIIFILLGYLFSGLLDLIYYLFDTNVNQSEPSALRAQIAIALGAIPFLLLNYGMIRNRYRYKVYREKVTLENLPKALVGLKIVQISDIHSGSFTKKEPIKAGIDLINNLKPDLVFFTGDLVNNLASEMDPYIDLFSQINAKYGVFSITGNHDYADYVRWDSLEDKNANFQKLINVHKQLGWNLLMNENTTIEIDGISIAIIGVENYSASARFSKYGDLYKAYKGAEHASFKFLLSHDPTHWEDQILKDFKDISITFSGHTHGFQFGLEIPGWIKWSPSKYVYKQWAGLYQSGKQYLYVNRGFGFLGYPGRVGILPEITFMELQSAQKAKI